MSKRLDVLLAEKAYAKSRAKAKELILKGCVSVNERVALKPSVLVEDADNITVTNTEHYVGRGALKLKSAFDCFDLNVKGKCCADLGASTGGFTQVLLENGASKVYAVDVGHDQLAKELVDDERVCNCEGVNVRDLTPDFFSEPVDFMCGDLSFISLRLAMPPMAECLRNDGEMVMLIKPQFEAGRAALNKKGIVKNKKDHVRVLQELSDFFKNCKLALIGLEVSAITGGDGNIEYLAHLKKCDDYLGKGKAFNINKLVNLAFEKFR